MGAEDTAPRSALPPVGDEEGSIRLALIDPPAARSTLSAAGPPVPPSRSADQADTEDTAAWHSEGGHLYR